MSAVKWLCQFLCLVFLEISEPWPKTTISAHSPMISSIIPFCCHWYKRATAHKCNWSCIVSCWAYTDRNGYHARESPCMPPQSAANSKRTVTIAMNEYRGTIWPHWKIWMRFEILFLTIKCVNTVYHSYMGSIICVGHYCGACLQSIQQCADLHLCRRHFDRYEPILSLANLFGTGIYNETLKYAAIKKTLITDMMVQNFFHFPKDYKLKSQWRFLNLKSDIVIETFIFCIWIWFIYVYLIICVKKWPNK